MSRQFVKALANPLDPNAPIAIHLNPFSGAFTATVDHHTHQATTLHDLEQVVRQSLQTQHEPWRRLTAVALPTPSDPDAPRRGLLRPERGWFRRVAHHDDTDLMWATERVEVTDLDGSSAPPDDAEEEVWALGPVPPLPADATPYVLEREGADQVLYPADPTRDDLLRQLDQSLTELLDVLTHALASLRLPTPALLADLVGALHDTTSNLTLILAHRLPEAP